MIKILRNKKTGKYIHVSFGDTVMLEEVDDPKDASFYNPDICALRDEDILGVVEDETYFELNGHSAGQEDIELELVRIRVEVEIVEA